MINFRLGIKFLRRKGFILLSIFLVISLALFISLNNASYNLDNLAKNAWNNYVGNIRISGSFNEDFINEIKEDKNVEDIRGVVTIYAYIDYEGKKYSALLVYVSENSSLMDYVIKEGNLEGVVLINSKDFKIGENVKIQFNNLEKNITVTGYASAFYTFGLVNYRFLISKEVAKTLLNEIKYDIIFLKVKETKNFENKILEIANLTNSKLESILFPDPEAFPGKNEIDAARRTFNIFLILTLITLSLAMFIYQLIYLENNSKELAILNIFGLTKNDLFIFYMTPLIIVLIISSILGITLSFPLSVIFFNSATNSIPLGFSEIFLLKYKYVFNYELIIYNYFIFILIFLSFSLITFYYIKRKNILELIFLISFKKFSRMLKFNSKIKLYLNLISNNIWKFILIVVLISLIISSLTSLSSLKVSWDSSVSNLNDFYDYFIYAIGNSSEIPKNYEISVWKAVFHFAKVNEKDVTVATFLINKTMPILIEGEWAKKRGEVVISLTLSKTENIKINDYIVLDTGIKNYKFKVVGIASIPIFFLYTRETRTVVLYFEDYFEIFGKGNENVIFLKGNYEGFINELNSKGFYITYIRSKEESIKLGKEGGGIAFVFLNMLSYTLLAVVISLIGMIISFELSSKLKEIGLLILVGFRRYEIILMVIFALLIITMLSLPLSYILSLYIMSWNVSEIIPFTGYFISGIDFISFLTSLVYVIFTILLVVLVSYRIIKRIKLQELLLKF